MSPIARISSWLPVMHSGHFKLHLLLASMLTYGGYEAFMSMPHKRAIMKAYCDLNNEMSLRMLSVEIRANNNPISLAL